MGRKSGRRRESSCKTRSEHMRRRLRSKRCGCRETSGKSISQVAKELGIPDSNLARWCRQYGAEGEQAFVGSGHVPAHEEELRRLRRENEVLRQERDMLKKSIAIFSHL